MKKTLLVFICIATFSLCTPSFDKQEQAEENIADELVNNSDSLTNDIGESMELHQDSGLTNLPFAYVTEATIKRKFRKEKFFIRLYAEFSSKGYGQLDSLSFTYDGKLHRIQIPDFYLYSSDDLTALDDHLSYKINFKDYNFDNYPDLTIYNSSSGSKNIMEDVFVYHPEKKQFVYDNRLSGLSNISVDTIAQTIYTFGQGGMASKIYGSATYKWEEDELVVIKKVLQDFDDKLDAFVREIHELHNDTWNIRRDTFAKDEPGVWE
ncbi:MAG: XAC2610-related protein [Cytophagaceae bacterium]